MKCNGLGLIVKIRKKSFFITTRLHPLIFAVQGCCFIFKAKLNIVMLIY